MTKRNKYLRKLGNAIRSLKGAPNCYRLFKKQQDAPAPQNQDRVDRWVFRCRQAGIIN